MEDLKEEIAQEEAEEKEPKKEKSFVFLYVAAVYLAYNGYSLCNSFFQKEEGATLPFCLCGIVFILIAIGICVYALKNGTKQTGAKKDNFKREQKEG